MTSAAGASLGRLPDGSVLAGGENPDSDTYTIEAVTDRSGITGLRLEVLPDPSLPCFGPGRYPANGNFVMDTIRLSAVSEPPAPASGRRPIPLTRVRADHEQLDYGFRGAPGAIDSSPKTAWAIGELFGQAHWAVFQTAEPFGTGAGTRLRVELSFATFFEQHALGRFRLSVTNQPFPLFEPSLMRIKADRERNGLVRLAAAYGLAGDWASAAAVLERAAAQPGASALGGFLLALARHHLGRPAAARRDCDRARQRLQNEKADDEARDVAVEALRTIQGLSAAEAELLLLNDAFPADSFAP
jgi:hypothetical protein